MPRMALLRAGRRPARGLLFAVLTLRAAAAASQGGGLFATGKRGGSDGGENRYELVQLQLLHRHGDRAPNVHLRQDAFWASTHPSLRMLAELAAQFPVNVLSDGSQPEPQSPEALCLPAAGSAPWGRLSTLGIAQLTALGAGLREALTKGAASLEVRGADFGPEVDTRRWLPAPTPDMVKVYSTGPPLTTTRTLESVRALLSGLFPSNARDLGISLELLEPMIPDRAGRPEAQKRAEAAQEGRVIESQGRLAFRRQATEALVALGLLDVETSMAEQPGKWIGPALKCTALMEVLNCLKSHGMEVAAVGQEARQLIMRGSEERWHDVYNDSLDGRVVKAFGAGAMCRKMLGTTLRAAQGAATEKLVIYSGHDATLITVMCTLGLDYRKWPPYASCFRLELLREKSTGELRARFVLNGDVIRLKGVAGAPDGTYGLDALEMRDRELDEMVREAEKELQVV